MVVIRAGCWIMGSIKRILVSFFIANQLEAIRVGVPFRGPTVLLNKYPGSVLLVGPTPKSNSFFPGSIPILPSSLVEIHPVIFVIILLNKSTHQHSKGNSSFSHFKEAICKMLSRSGLLNQTQLSSTLCYTLHLTAC